MSNLCDLHQHCNPYKQTVLQNTRLHPFARSRLYNATAMRSALWWVRQSHSVNYVAPSGDCERVIVNYANHQHSPFARRRHDVSDYIPPIVWWKFHENPFSRSRERLSHSFGGREKNKKKQQQKQKKRNNCKTYTHPPPTGRRLCKLISNHCALELPCWLGGLGLTHRFLAYYLVSLDNSDV